MMVSTSVRPSKTLGNYICTACRQRKSLTSRAMRSFLSTSPKSAAGDATTTQTSSIFNASNRSKTGSQNSPQPTSASAFKPARASERAGSGNSRLLDILDNASRKGQEHRNFADRELRDLEDTGSSHHVLNVYSTKHNTHITFAQPKRLATESLGSSITEFGASAKQKEKKVDTLISLSCGNLGFRKANRGTYDAAFQLSAFALKQIQEKGLLREIQSLELVFRGFGDGREAFQKVLLGVEGKAIRNRIVVVRDSTRLKFGGTRSKKPRRL